MPIDADHMAAQPHRGGRGHHRGDRHGYGFPQDPRRRLGISTPTERSPAQRSTALGGAEILLVFVAAVVVMVAAVTVVAEVNRWWVLVPAMVVALVTVLGVLATITHLLADDG
jgi:hypothetical protein